MSSQGIEYVKMGRTRNGCFRCGSVNSFMHRIPQVVDVAFQDFGQCPCGQKFSIITVWHGNKTSVRVEAISELEPNVSREGATVWLAERVFFDEA